MKIRKDEESPIEYTKLIQCKDCGEVRIKVGKDDLTAPEFLANGCLIIEIERDELPLFNEFLSDAGHFLRVGWDYIQYQEEKDFNEWMEEHGDDEDGDDKKEKINV